MNKFKSRQTKNNTTGNISSAFIKNRSAENNATANVSFSASREAKNKATKNF